MRIRKEERVEGKKGISRALSIFLSPMNNRAQATITCNVQVKNQMNEITRSTKILEQSKIHHHGIIFTRFDGIDTACFALVALLKKNSLSPKKTGMRAFLKGLIKGEELDVVSKTNPTKLEPVTFWLRPVALPQRWLHFEWFLATKEDLLQWRGARAQEPSAPA